jgi:hypothetical protein
VVRACGRRRGNGGGAVGDDRCGRNRRRGRRQLGGIRGVRLWEGMDRGCGDIGRHDSVGAGQQTGGGETEAVAVVGNRERGALGATLRRSREGRGSFGARERSVVQGSTS